MSAVLTPTNPATPQGEDPVINELYKLFRPHPEEETVRFRFGKFILRFAFHFLVLAFIASFLLTHSGNQRIIDANRSPGPWKFWTWLVIALAAVCFGEHALHIHFMHKGKKFSPIPGVSFLFWPVNQLICLINLWSEAMKASHQGVHHHIAGVDLKGRAISNEMPINTVAKTASATFPTLILFIVWAVCTPVIIVLQLILPDCPVILTFYLALTWGVGLYEIAHAIFHKDDEWLRRQCRRRFIGPIILWILGIHFVHHIHARRNLAVGGFLLIPLADMVYGTYRYLPELMAAWLRNNPEENLEPIFQRARAELNRERRWFCRPIKEPVKAAA